MEPKDITALAIKFFGIYLLVNIVIYAPYMITMMTSLESYIGEEFDAGLYVTVVGSFLLIGVLVSLLLFRLSNSIVLRIEGKESTNININQEFLLQVLGVYIIVSSVSAFPELSSSFFNPKSESNAWLFYGLGDLFQLSVGIFLLIKSSVWVRWLNKLRGRS